MTTDTTTVQWVGMGLDDQVGFELTFDRPVQGRFPADGRRATWVQDHFTLTAELTDLPEGVADLLTCHRILSAVGADLAPSRFRQAVLRRLIDGGPERELIWWTREQGELTEHRVLVGVCTGRSTIATLQVTWTAGSGDVVAAWPTVRTLLEQWKVTVR